MACCCQLCFTDGKGVSESAGIYFILILTELKVEMQHPSSAPDSTADSTPSLIPVLLSISKGKSLEVESWSSSRSVTLPSAAPFTPLTCSFFKAVFQPGSSERLLGSRPWQG